MKNAKWLNVFFVLLPELYSSSTSSSNLSSPLVLAGEDAVSLYAESVLDETLSSEFGLLLRWRTSYKHKTKKSGSKFIQRNTRWTIEQRKRWCQRVEVGQFWWRARTSHEKHKPRLSPQKRNCRPYFVGKELNYTEHTKKVANCMISQFQLYLLSGFVRKNKATKRVEIFQRSPFLRLWNDLQKRSGKWISR